jgi:diketogulonate reductase-like aldo/keto reductase
VLVMRPFEGGELFSRTRAKPLPELARELDCESWAQYFLKFILGHPAVTCPIPATANPRHVADNLRAGFGRFPEEPALRKRMIDQLGV